MRFRENAFQQKAFQRNAFHEMQEKHDGEKARKPRLLIISMGSSVQQQLLDISASPLRYQVAAAVQYTPQKEWVT